MNGLDFRKQLDVKDLYTLIDWNNDPFWKTTKIKHVYDFENYLKSIDAVIRVAFGMVEENSIKKEGVILE